MRWTLLAASTAIAATLWLPGEAAQAAASVGEAAQPAAPAAATAGADTLITFEEYRDWRLNFIERRQSDLARQLTAGDLAASQKARLEQAKAYYDGYVALHIPIRPVTWYVASFLLFEKGSSAAASGGAIRRSLAHDDLYRGALPLGVWPK